MNPCDVDATSDIGQVDNLTSGFNACVLLLTMNFMKTMSEPLGDTQLI